MSNNNKESENCRRKQLPILYSLQRQRGVIVVNVIYHLSHIIILVRRRAMSFGTEASGNIYLLWPGRRSCF